MHYYYLLMLLVCPSFFAGINTFAFASAPEIRNSTQSTAWDAKTQKQRTASTNLVKPQDATKDQHEKKRRKLVGSPNFFQMLSPNRIPPNLATLDSTSEEIQNIKKLAHTRLQSPTYRSKLKNWAKEKVLPRVFLVQLGLKHDDIPFNRGKLHILADYIQLYNKKYQTEIDLLETLKTEFDEGDLVRLLMVSKKYHFTPLAEKLLNQIQKGWVETKTERDVVTILNLDDPKHTFDRYRLAMLDEFLDRIKGRGRNQMTTFQVLQTNLEWNTFVELLFHFRPVDRSRIGSFRNDMLEYWYANRLTPTDLSEIYNGIPSELIHDIAIEYKNWLRRLPAERKVPDMG